MRNSILAALMAATALIPGAAIAQRGEDRGGWNRNDRGTTVAERLGTRQERPVREARVDRPQPQRDMRAPDSVRADRGPREGSRGDSGFRGRGQRDAQPVQAAPVAPVTVAQPNRQDRGNWRGNDRSNDRNVRSSTNRGDTVRGNDASNTDRRNTDWRNDGNRGDNRGGDWRGNDNRGGNWGNNDRRSNVQANRGNWNRGWRQDNRYDWNRRRQYNRNAFHLPRYYAPSNWSYGYRRFNIGFTLSSVLFRQNYWIGNADYYGLPEAYGPYRWVRYYNDALLVDIYSGQVVDTVYGIFW